MNAFIKKILFTLFICCLQLVTSQQKTTDFLVPKGVQKSNDAYLQKAKKQIDSLKGGYNSELIKQRKDSLTAVPTTFISPNYSTELEVYTADNVPNPKKGGANGYISDPNNYIDAFNEAKINRLIWDIEQKTTAQIAVVMLKSIGDEVPKNFAVNLFEKWGIGQADTDNGLLILTVIDQRRTEFEVGYGLEPILTDVVCHRIGTNEIVPAFKQGLFGEGIFNAIKRVQQFIETPEAINEIYSSSIQHEESSNGLNIFLIIFLVYGIITAILSIWKYGVAYDIERSKDDYYDKYHRLIKQRIGCLAWLFPLPLLFFSKMLKERLKKYRYARRYSKINGKELYLKNAWAENKFLEEAQILEEKLNAVLYDVWVTADESDILVLEYEGSSRKYTRCKKCNYKTFGREKTIVLTTATYKRDGLRRTYYNCRNCHYKEEIESVIPQLIKSSSSSSSSSFGGSSGSSSSSSFGGGSSGGGGAGVSW